MPFFQGTAVIPDQGDGTRGSFFKLSISADTTVTAPGGPVSGTVTFEITTVGTASRTVTFGTGFAKTQGTLATGTTAGKVFILRFIYNGTGWEEASRTTAM